MSSVYFLTISKFNRALAVNCFRFNQNVNDTTKTQRPDDRADKCNETFSSESCDFATAVHSMDSQISIH